jgi:hypothetical protein
MGENLVTRPHLRAPFGMSDKNAEEAKGSARQLPVGHSKFNAFLFVVIIGIFIPTHIIFLFTTILSFLF